MLRLDAAVSLGNWKFTGDASGKYQQNEYDSLGNVTGLITTDYEYALNDLKVGDMPQTAFVLGAVLTPLKGLRLQGIYHIYDNNYADWSPAAREIEDGEADRAQVWEAPGYQKLDLHLTYKLPKIGGYDLTLEGHLFNALNGVFIQDAVDNSKYNGYGDKVHAAHNAEVFLGTQRYANLGLTVSF